MDEEKKSRVVVDGWDSGVVERKRSGFCPRKNKNTHELPIERLKKQGKLSGIGDKRKKYSVLKKQRAGGDRKSKKGGGTKIILQKGHEEVPKKRENGWGQLHLGGTEVLSMGGLGDITQGSLGGWV